MEEQKAKRADKKREVKETRKEGGFRFRHAFLIILVLLLLLSLFSHNQTDLNILAGGIDAPLKNWIGPAGANIAMSMLYMFGLAAYPLTVFLVACALRPLIPVPVRRRGYTGALIAVIAGTTVLFAMWPENFCHITEKIGLGHSGAPGSALSGGLLGQKIAAPENSASVGLLRGVIGSVGTLIVGTVLLITGGVFVFIADWLPLFQELKRRRESNSGREKKEKKAPKEKKTTSPAEEDEEEEEEKVKMSSNGSESKRILENREKSFLQRIMKNQMKNFNLFQFRHLNPQKFHLLLFRHRLQLQEKPRLVPMTTALMCYRLSLFFRKLRLNQQVGRILFSSRNVSCSQHLTVLVWMPQLQGRL
jgi:uncharacterized integral membrane protein